MADERELVRVYLTGDDGRPTPDAPSFTVSRDKSTGIIRGIMPAEEANEEVGRQTVSQMDRAVAIPAGNVDPNDLRAVSELISTQMSMPEDNFFNADNPRHKEQPVVLQELAIPQQEQVREMAGMTIRGDAPERSGEEELRGVRKMEGMTIRGGRGGRDR